MRKLFARGAALAKEIALEVERVVPRPLVPLLASVGIHLFVLPFIYLYIAISPGEEKDDVFFLVGDLLVEEDEDLVDEDDEEADEDEEVDEDEDTEDEELEDGVDTSDSSKFDKWGFPKPGAFKEEDEDWDSDWFDDDEPVAKVRVTEEDESVIVDEDLEDEDGEEEVEPAVGEHGIEIVVDEPTEEEIEEQIEKFGSGAKKWDSIFAEAGDEAAGKPGAASTVDETIRAFIERNPYEDVAGGGDPAPYTQGQYAEYDARLPELLDWMPSDSLMAALVSLDLLRARPDREELERTFRSLGYFHEIAGGSDLSFFDDIDAVLIATSDPLDVEQTFLILRHRLDDEDVRAAIDRQFENLALEPNWYSVGGRGVVQADKKGFEKLPWIYFLPRSGYVAVLHASQRDRLTTYMGSDGFGPGAPSRLIGELERHIRLSLILPMIEAGITAKDGAPKADPMPIAVVLGCVMFGDAFKAVVDGSPFPSPGNVFLSGRFGEDGGIRIDGSAAFPAEADAEGFLARWKERIEPLHHNKLLEIIGAAKLIDLAVWGRDTSSVTLGADVPAADVAQLMALVRLLTADPDEKLPPADPKPAKPSKPLPKKPKKDQ